MNTRRKTLLALVGAVAVGAAFAAPSVEILSVQQQYPWTNTVDIGYQVEGVTNMDYFVKFTPTTSAGVGIPDVNGQYDIQVALTNSGTYVAQWYPQTNQQYTACRMTPAIFRGAAKDYMIIDLATGEVAYEPMATQAASNERYQADEYKTTKMVFRRIEGNKSYRIGATMAGRSGVWSDNSPHDVNIPADYYIAIFEMTQAQYACLVNGDTSSTVKCYQGVTWNAMRGSALIAAKPTSGVVAALSQKTGLCIDLPTHAMTEVALRAGVTTLWMGGEASKNTLYAPCGGNAITQVVGLFSPNVWGVYDILGPRQCWCRDGVPPSNTTYADAEAALATGFVPITTGTNRTYIDTRSDWAADDYRMTPSAIWSNSPSTSWAVRLAAYPADYYPSGVKQ